MTKEILLQSLKDEGIAYESYEHSHVMTIAQMDEVFLPHKDAIAKNLFLRDDKKRHYYLISLPGHKRINLKALRSLLQSRPLSFANEQDLQCLLGLAPGAVTPFGLLNDAHHQVQGFLDQDFQGELIGVHPLENDQTLFLSSQDLIDYLKKRGHEINYLQIQEDLSHE